MRSVIDEHQFTPFGLWIRQYLRPSSAGLSVTNLDYILDDFRNRRIMLLEEKQNGGRVHKGQLLTFQVLDRALSVISPRHGYEYWGFYTLQFPRGKSMPGPGMTLNGHVVTAEDLVDHLNFERQFCRSYFANRYAA